MTTLTRRVLAWLATRAGAHVRGWCGCLACDRTEREARAAIGMPAVHPERITRDLPGGQEDWLAAVATELWPDDEYTAIFLETRREEPS
jgi:hypothetical protein